MVEQLMSKKTAQRLSLWGPGGVRIVGDKNAENSVSQLVCQFANGRTAGRQQRAHFLAVCAAA
jgi:hypothetical protein